MKKFRKFLSAGLVLVLALSIMSPAVFASAAETNDTIPPASEDRTGKIVRVYVDNDGNETVVEIQPGQKDRAVMAGVEFVGQHKLSAATTAQMKKNIQGMTQASNLATALAVFVPSPYAKFFLAISRVGIFAEDVRWAGTYGKSIVLTEWCKLPHTSYSHYYEYTIV